MLPCITQTNCYPLFLPIAHFVATSATESQLTMGLSNNWFRWFRKTSDESNSPHVSLFKLIPFTATICFWFGVPLSNPTKVHHWVLFVVTLVPRILYSYSAMKYDLEVAIAMISINQLTFLGLGYIFLFVLARNKSKVVSFLTSDASVAREFRKIDLLCPLLILVPMLLQHFPIFISPPLFVYFETKCCSLLQCCPTVKYIVARITFVSVFLWFQLIPLCSVFYSLGFRILYSHKMSILTEISNNWRSSNFDSILLKLNTVCEKQKQFESIFGPFLFICLCYNFISTVFFINLVNRLILGETSFLFYYAASMMSVQLICITLVLLISIYNEKIKTFANFISAQLECRLTEEPLSTFFMINYLRKKIYAVANEPLTACKMVTLDRQIILTVATSCVTFSVLLIQINNGALGRTGN